MDVFTCLKKRERGNGCTNMNFNFALRRFASSKGDLHIFKKLGMEVPPFACRFCRVVGSESVAAVANEDGAILLLDTSRKPGRRVVTSWTAHNNAIFDVSWLTCEPKLISVSGDHCAALWDVSERKCLTVFTGHTGTIKCVDICPTQNAVFATGSRDGSVRIWDLRVSKKGRHHVPEIIIETSSSQPQKHSKAKPQKHQKEGINNSLSSVTSLVFQNEHHVVSSGVTDGVINVWDLRKTYCSTKKQPKPHYQLALSGSKIHGFTNLTMDSSRTQLYACCTNSIIYHYDCHTYNPQYVNSYCGHRASSYYIKIAVSSDDRYLLSGSGDHFAYIWELAKPTLPLLQLPGHTEEVTAVAWSPSDLKAISCGDDEQILIWDISGEGEEVGEESTIFSSAVPYDISEVTKAPKEDSPLCDAEVLKSETPSVPQRPHSSTSLKNTAVKKKTSPKHSSFAITRWFSPLGSSASPETPQRRNTTPEGKIPDGSLVKINSATHISLESESLKQRKSDGTDSEERNPQEVLSPHSANSSVHCTVLLTDKTDCVVDSGILSPSKTNSVNGRILSPSKTNCMSDNSEMTGTTRDLNFAGMSRSEVDQPCHKVTQNTTDKENVFCYEISPTRISDMCNSSEPENCMPKGYNSYCHKTSFSNNKLVNCALQKSARGNRIMKKTSKRRSREEKRKAERSITTYFSVSSSGSCS